MGSMSIVHWLIVVGIVVLLFGKHKISAVMGDVAHGIKSFKKGMSDDEAASAGSEEKLTESPTETSNGPSAARMRNLEHVPDEISSAAPNTVEAASVK